MSDPEVQPGAVLRITAVCLTLHADQSGSDNRVLLYVDSRLIIDVVDVWNGERGGNWWSYLAVQGGDTAAGIVVFDHLTMRDASRDS